MKTAEVVLSAFEECMCVFVISFKDICHVLHRGVLVHWYSKQKAPRMSLLGFDVVQLEEKLKANHTFL